MSGGGGVGLGEPEGGSGRCHRNNVPWKNKQEVGPGWRLVTNPFIAAIALHIPKPFIK